MRTVKLMRCSFRLDVLTKKGGTFNRYYADGVYHVEAVFRGRVVHGYSDSDTDSRMWFPLGLFLTTDKLIQLEFLLANKIPFRVDI